MGRELDLDLDLNRDFSFGEKRETAISLYPRSFSSLVWSRAVPCRGQLGQQRPSEVGSIVREKVGSAEGDSN